MKEIGSDLLTKIGHSFVKSRPICSLVPGGAGAFHIKPKCQPRPSDRTFKLIFLSSQPQLSTSPQPFPSHTQPKSKSMGKGKGKKAKREEKLAKRAAKNAAKAEQRASAPKKSRVPKVKPTNPDPVPPEGTSYPSYPPLPSESSKPLVRPLHGAKWPSLFKKHLGVLESHIKALDRVRQSLKNDMSKMEEEERRMWEMGEKGQWLIICDLLDRARMTLASGREAAKGIVSRRILPFKFLPG